MLTHIRESHATSICQPGEQSLLGSIRPGFSKSTYESVKKKHQAKREFKVGGKNFRFYQCAKSGCGVWVTEKSNLPNLKKHGLPQKSGFKFSDETHAELQHRSCWMKHLSKRRKRDADIDGRTLLYYSKADAKDAHDDEKNLTIWCQKCNGPDGQRAVRDNAAKEAVKPEWDF